MSEYLKLFETTNEYNSYKESEDLITPNVSLCKDQNKIHYSPYIDIFNGHEYVDLDLPSETLWATKNVGARTITDYGEYFQWGDPSSGVLLDTINIVNDNYYSEDLYNKYFITPPVNDIIYTLDMIDDCANLIMKGNWHTPSVEQAQELISNTTYQLVTNYQESGVNGILFTSKNNSETLFFPLGGYIYSGDSDDVNEGGNYWLNSNDIGEQNANYITIYGNTLYISNESPSYRFNVRGVINK